MLGRTWRVMAVATVIGAAMGLAGWWSRPVPAPTSRAQGLVLIRVTDSSTATIVSTIERLYNSVAVRDRARQLSSASRRAIVTITSGSSPLLLQVTATAVRPTDAVEAVTARMQAGSDELDTLSGTGSAADFGVQLIAPGDASTFTPGRSAVDGLEAGAAGGALGLAAGIVFTLLRVRSRDDLEDAVGQLVVTERDAPSIVASWRAQRAADVRVIGTDRVAVDRLAGALAESGPVERHVLSAAPVSPVDDEAAPRTVLAVAPDDRSATAASITRDVTIDLVVLMAGESRRGDRTPPRDLVAAHSG